VTESCGNLFVICIPKGIIEDSNKTIVFRAHPYGKPCDCHSEDKDIEVLKQLQQNNLNDTSLCNNGTVPQYRLLAASLIPENDVYCFGLTALDKKTKKQIKEEAAQIASEAFAFSI
jgi:hypothetical protein